MSFAETLILWVYGGIVGMWVIRHGVVTWLERRLPRLGRNSPRWEGRAEDAPLVTAIIPAKDEESTLAECLESVLGQDYPALEVLVVNDRSGDRTGEIAEEFARRDGRTRVLTIRELPAGWTGKTHAMRRGADEARGEWLWFLDADTRHEPECLSIVLRHAADEGAALASLIPRLRCETFFERVVQPLAGIVLMRSFPPIRVNDDARPEAFANGQFILARREDYEAVGGHGAVRDRFVEDIFLARRFKESGRRIRVAMAYELSSTRMYTGLGQITRGWSRILYDALDRRIAPLAGKILEPLIFSQTAHIALIAGLALWWTGGGSPGFAGWLIGLSAVHHALSHTLLYRLYRQTSEHPSAAIWYGLSGLVMDVVFVKAIASCVTGRVTWRGTSYEAGGAGRAGSGGAG